MNLENLFTKKHVLFVSFLGVVLLLGFLSFNYSFLTISSASNDKITILVRSGDYQKNFSLQKGSKRLLLKRGTYSIEASNTDKTTKYVRSTGSIWSGEEIAIKLLPQKESVYLGISPLNCAIRGKTTVFYSCDPSEGGFIRSPDPNGFDNGPYELERILSDYSQVIAPFEDGFLEVVSSGGKLEINKKDLLGKVVSKGTMLDDYESSVSDNTVAVDEQSGAISLYNSYRNELYYFDLFDSAPKKIDLQDKINPDNTYNIRLVVSDRVAFIAGDVVDETGGIEGEDAHSGKTFIMSVDIDDQKIIKQTNFDDASIRVFSPTQNESILAVQSSKDKNIILSLNKFLEDSELPSFDDARDICESSDGSYYFLSDAGKSIYRHSLKKKASFLVYSAADGFIPDINCVGKKVYFTFDSPSDGESNDKLHFVVGSKDATRPRLESILPQYISANGLIFQMQQRPGEGVLIRPGASTTNLTINASGEEIRKQAIDKLKDLGISVSNITIDVSL